MIRRLFAPFALILPLALPAHAEPPRVVTDITPVQSLVEMVTGDLTTPEVIVRHGASPHNYTLRPSEAARIEAADLVVWIGPELEPNLAHALDRLAGTARLLRLSDLPETLRLPARTGATFEPHHHGTDEHEDGDSDHDHEGEDSDHDHHHEGGLDPHLWLDPDNAIAWLGPIAGALADLDPENAETYRANAESAQERLADLTAETRASLAPLAGRGFIVFHDAYQYFEHAFGLSAAGAISLSDATPPSPARLAELKHLVEEGGVVCAFSEPQFNPGLLEAIGAETGLRTGVLDPLGADLEPGAGFYPALIREIAARMIACLGDKEE